MDTKSHFKDDAFVPSHFLSDKEDKNLCNSQQQAVVTCMKDVANSKHGSSSGSCMLVMSEWNKCLAMDFGYIKES